MASNPHNITVQVVFFAALREQLNCEKIDVNIPTNNSDNSGNATVQSLLNHLVNEQPAWQTALTSSSLLMAVNHNMVDKHQVLSAGDEVAFFPPVTGG